MKQSVVTAIVLVGLAGSVLAHAGVKDPGVMARMHVMKQVGDAMKTLGDMAKGARGFDATQAAEAKTALIGHLQEVAPLFREPHSDPKSEALPVIWEQYSDFATQAQSAVTAAGGLDVNDLDGLRSSIAAVGQSCQSCHKTYRQK